MLIKNAISVGNENETIDALKRLLTYRTQWCNRISEVVKAISVSSESANNAVRLTNQAHFPFRLCGMLLPQDQTGTVFFFLSKRDKSVYIGRTMHLQEILQNQNSGTSLSSLLLCRCPHALVACIVRFKCNISHAEETKEQWAGRE